MKLDRSLGDGQPEPYATGRRVATLIDAEERFEDVCEHPHWYSMAIVAHTDDGLTVPLAYRDVDLTIRRGVLDGVSDDIVQGAREGLGRR